MTSSNKNSWKKDFSEKLDENGKIDDSDILSTASLTSRNSKSFKPVIDFTSDTDSMRNGHLGANDVLLQEDDEFRQGCWLQFLFFLKHSLRDVKRHKCHFCVACCSVFITVISTLVVNTVVT